MSFGILSQQKVEVMEIQIFTTIWDSISKK
jgi:hypothetical protein